MESSLQSRSPDNYDVKPSFRKPSNDAANRKYRRRSPIGGSASSSSDGSPKRDRSYSPNYSREEPTKTSDDRRRKDDGRDLDRDSSRNRSGKDIDSYRYSERQSYGNSTDHRRHDDYSRHHRHADEDERSYQRSSRVGRESRGSTRPDYTRQENDHDRAAREDWRNGDKYSRDRPDDRGHRKEKEREAAVSERHRDKDVSSDRNTDDMKMGERDRHRDRGGDRVERKDHRRSSGDYRNDHAKDSTMSRGIGVSRSKETHKSSNKVLDGQKEDMTQKRKHDDKERDRHKERYDRDREEHAENGNRSSSSYRGRDAKNEQYQDQTIDVNEDEDSASKKLKSSHSDKAADCAEDGQMLSKSSKLEEKLASSSKQVHQTVGKLTSEPSHSSASEAEVAHDLNAAKVAAMKAAELVNRNLVGGGYMSTDQKKKLLWGNKKNAAVEELQSGNRWDVPLFSDRERQEKFNKLMGVKGDLKPENKPNDKDRAEKQEQLQLELEKQYTAGLRRRDGRTVGLGL